MTFDLKSVEVTCVTLPKDHFFQSIIRINTTIRKKIVLYISDADLFTYDTLGACTGSFIHKPYRKMG